MLLVVTLLFAVSGFGQAPPSWAIGDWTAHNDAQHNDVDVQIGDDGKCTITFRTAQTTQTFLGSYRPGRIETSSDRYTLRQLSADVEILRVGDRTATLLSRAKPSTSRDELAVSSFRGRYLPADGRIFLSGQSIASEVHVEIKQGQKSVFEDTLPVNSGRFQTNPVLPPGSYIATFTARGSRGNLVRTTSVDVSRLRQIHIDRPIANNNHAHAGEVLIEGSSDADRIDIEITRGFERVYIDGTHITKGRWSFRPKLTPGHYVVTVRTSDQGDVATDKFGFDVD